LKKTLGCNNKKTLSKNNKLKI